MRGRFGEARRLVSKARSSYEELGQVSVAEANCGTIAAGIELLSGDAKAAVRLLRGSCKMLELTGDRAYLATRAAELADVLCLETCDDEAERWITVAEASAAVDDLPTQFLARCVRAKLLARRGELAEAEVLAREAVALIEETVALNDRAKTLLDLAEVLCLADRARGRRSGREGDRSLRAQGERRRRQRARGLHARWFA